MKEDGHIGLALVILAPITFALAVYGNTVLAAAFFVPAVVMSTVPDIDIKLQRLTGDDGIPILNRVITIRHRGITHTLYFAFLFIGPISAAAAWLLMPMVTVGAAAYLGGAFGVILHLLGDIVTPTGLDVLPPYTDTVSFNMYNYNNVIANLGFAIGGILSFTILVTLLYQPQREIAYLVPVVYFVYLPLVIIGATVLEIRSDRVSDAILAPFKLTWWLRQLT